MPCPGRDKQKLIAATWAAKPAEKLVFRSPSEKPEGTQFGKHAFGHRGDAAGARWSVRRRVGRRQIAPSLERPPRPQQCRHEVGVDVDPAIGAAIVVALALEARDALAHANLAADDPVNRAAGQDLLGAARMVAGVDPTAAALLEARGAKPAQLVDVADADRHL